MAYQLTALKLPAETPFALYKMMTDNKFDKIPDKYSMNWWYVLTNMIEVNPNKRTDLTDLMKLDWAKAHCRGCGDNDVEYCCGGLDVAKEFPEETKLDQNSAFWNA